ncbi:DNA-deoxyinosine glycosylase [Mycobacterium sp. Y57]|uniref:DNA-deoxyinosine glycosylase n=1 Tax=Mycolicibacterium xanthum TaxID=2796469 RepID=UPI001C86510C|nr:DNA-deoxyinosine glycosylase [Mycolicibacterium xanthum]MBX7432448.1 DNA-deoxyinosine glycosylase [Mycolicibacterium xanthum]
MSPPTLHSFPPLIAPGAQILILGNMPGVASLAAQQYYAFGRNAFWRITGELFGFDPTGPYDARVAALTGAGVAVWDVLRSCRRIGSLDAAVEPDSMVANDFGALFTAHPTIAKVYFNGSAAQTNYRRLVRVEHAPAFTRLPSTSPAHTMRFEDKLAAWREVTGQPPVS